MFLFITAIVFIYNTKKIIYKGLLNKFSIEFMINTFMLVLSYMIYINLKDSREYLDNQEKLFIQRMIIIISLSRIPYLLHTIINSVYIEYILSNVINTISIIYLYRYVTYSSFYKPYMKLNEANLELSTKNNYLKEKNIKLIKETKKIIHLKEIFENKENKLKSTLDTSTNCIMVFNDKKEITYANKKFKERFQYKTNEKVYDYKKCLKNNIIDYKIFINCIDNVLNDENVITRVIKVNNKNLSFNIFTFND